MLRLKVCDTSYMMSKIIVQNEAIEVINQNEDDNISDKIIDYGLPS